MTSRSIALTSQTASPNQHRVRRIDKNVLVPPSNYRFLVDSCFPPDATSTPIKSRDQNGRHVIPLTPESGNASLEGAITVHSNLPSPEPPRRPHSVVIAIDFGTTFSGYAYSFSRDPESIQIMRKWEGGDPGFDQFY